MVCPPAPRWRVRLRQLWVGLAVVGLATFGSFAQDQGKGKTAGKGTTTKAGTPKAGTAKAKANEEPADLEVGPSVWADPLRQKLLDNNFEELRSTPITDRDRGLVMQMAQGAASVDSALVKRYVEFYAAELSRRANIAAMMGLEGSDSKKARKLDEAAGLLLQPLFEQGAAGNASFRRAYLTNLLAVADRLLAGHMLTRSFYVSVLARVDGPEVLQVLINAIDDPDQPYSVKLMAAKAIITQTRNGRRTLNASTHAIPAASAIAKFLTNNPDTPWPIQARCLEALGDLRLSTADPNRPGSEFADLAFQILADPKAEPALRAWAGWALSRMTYSHLRDGINAELVAHQLGQVAAAASEKIANVPVPAANPTKNLAMVARWTEPLITIVDAFTNDPQVRNAGLRAMAKPGGAAPGIEQRIRALASASAQLSQSAGQQVVQSRTAVAAALAELNSFLQANAPKSNDLYRGGPALQAAAPAAEAAAANGAEAKQP